MSNELTTPNEGGGIVVATNDGSAMVARAITEMGVGLFDLERLRVPGSGGTTWEVPSLEGTTPMKELDLVITNVAMNQRSWYRTDAEDGDSGPPSCFSRDGIQGVGCNSLEDPGEDAQPETYSCAQCPWSQWGSDRGGGKGQDCREFAWIIGFPPGNSLPLQLSVPRMSLKPLRAYMLKLMGAGVTPEKVVTKLTLVKNGTGATAYSTISFAMASRLDEDACANTVAASAACAQLLKGPEPSAAPPTAGEGLV